MRKSFFVKPQLQLRNLLFSLAVTLAAALFIYLSLNYVVSSSARFLNIPPETLHAFKTIFHLTFAGVLFALLIAFGLENYFRFHRIAGPIFVIEKTLHSLAAGDFSNAPRALRKKDELKDIMNELQVMQSGMKTIVLEDRKILQSIMARLDNLAEIDPHFQNPVLQQEIESIKKDLLLVTSRYKV